MKKYLLFFILVTGCYSDVPDNLITEKKMESIIFDIMILNASSGYDLKIDNNLLEVSSGFIRTTFVRRCVPLRRRLWAKH